MHSYGSAGLAVSAPRVSTDAKRRDVVLEPLATVTRRVGLESMAAQLNELQTWMADDLSSLEAALAAYLPEHLREEPRRSKPARGEEGPVDLGGAPCPTVLPGTRARGAVEHLLGLKGKRIRPLCVILAARLGGRGLDAQVRAAAVACELIHAATLLHDDVIDNSAERRGAPTARVVFGNSASILAGDYLLVEALRLVERASCPGLMPHLLEVVAEMVAAEALQLERRGRFAPDRNVYLDVIRGKTASLFGWGLTSGGAIAGLGDRALQVLARVGRRLGMAFQLVDDLLDLDGDAATTGKEALVDLREGKLTWPLILAAERDPALRSVLEAIAAESQAELDTSRARAVVSQVRATGALQATRSLALEMAEQACTSLDELPSSAAQQALQGVVRYAVHRVR